jgi:DNA-binding MarR family transcriptional regulator
MDMETFSVEMCALSNLLLRSLGDRMRANGMGEVTVMQAMVIAYLANHPETYQRDLENEFQVNRSTITKIVQIMERKGYLNRLSVPQDKRLKQLVLTDLGWELNSRLEKCMEQTNRDCMEALSPQEGKALLNSMRKIREKLE